MVFIKNIIQKIVALDCSLQARLFNLRLLLTGGGMCDVYSLYSKTVCVLQV